MNQAYCLIREGPHYRRNAFLEGLRHNGFTVSVNQPPDGPHAGNVLVIWNRYGDRHFIAERFEKAGGRIVVAENGYMGRDAQGRQFYALSADWHQRPLIEVRSQKAEGRSSRFDALGIPLAPWREKGEHILICSQRCFGVPPHAHERKWPGQMANELRRYTKRPIRIRWHPEDKGVPPADRTKRRLEEDLVGCHAVVVWSSTAGVKSLIAGVPVFRCGPDFIAQDAAPLGIDAIEQPWMGDRMPALERAAWGQWSVDEIESGTPFRLWLAAVTSDR